jgi:hypothetical protein
VKINASLSKSFNKHGRLTKIGESLFFERQSEQSTDRQWGTTVKSEARAFMSTERKQCTNVCNYKKKMILPVGAKHRQTVGHHCQERSSGVQEYSA